MSGSPEGFSSWSSFTENWRIARDKMSFSFASLFDSVNVCWKRPLLAETEQRLLFSITWHEEDRLNSSRCSSCQSAALSNPVPLIVRSEVMTAWPSGPWPWLSYFTPYRGHFLHEVGPAQPGVSRLRASLHAVGELLWRPGWKDATWSKLYGGVIRNRVFS